MIVEKLEPKHAGQPFSRPVEEIKAAIKKRKGFLDLDEMRLFLKPDIEKKFQFKKGTLRYIFFAFNSVTDLMDVKAKGKLNNEWEGTSDKKTVREKEGFIVGLKASEYPKLIKGAKAFLRGKGWDLNDRDIIKKLHGIRFLVEYETIEDEPGKILAQLFYESKEGKNHMTPFIEGEF